MNSFEYCSPTEVVFGKKSEDKVFDCIKKYGGKRVLLVYGGGSIVKSGLLNHVEELLLKENVCFYSIGGVRPNPYLSFARTCIEKAIEFNADFILAVGGGSVIDTAKGIAIGVANPKVDIWDYWTGKLSVTKSLPVGVILTISAAGSETSESAVLHDEETNSKRGLSTDFIRPRFAIMNPQLTYTLPKYQIACGIADIMMHTLDRYFTQTEGNELTDEIAESVLRVVIKNGAAAMENPSDYDSMSELMWCGSISHNGLTGLGAVTDFAPHQLGHELSAMFDIAHGASLTTMWGAWARYSFDAKPKRFVRFAEKVWGIKKSTDDETAMAAIEATEDYFKLIGLPTCFSDSKIGGQSAETVHDLAVRCTFYGQRKIGSFKSLDEKDIYRIYKLANH